MSIDVKLQEINTIKQQCINHAHQMANNGYRTESTNLLMEIQGVENDLRRIEDMLTKAYLKADKIRNKWRA